MDRRRQLFSDDEPNEDNNSDQTNPPIRAARNGGEAPGDDDATHARTTRASKNQPSTAPDGNEHVSTQNQPGLEHNMLLQMGRTLL